MGKLLRITNPDGSVIFKDKITGEIVNPKQKTSSLSMCLSALGIIYFIASVIISFILFFNSSVKVNSMFGGSNQTNPITIAINVLFQGLIIMLICIALSKILDSTKTV